MTATSIVKFFHVFFAIAWVGGGILMQAMFARARSAGPEVVASFNEIAEWTSQRVFMPSSFLTLGFGIATVVVGGYDWADPWIGIGFVGFAISAILGMAIIGPSAKKMKELIAERGPNDPVVGHMARRIHISGRIDLISLIVVVFVMVTKPGV